uniref:DUF262 domain-containing protein n=1 Tax=Candidatus Methanogaster sp. ANME-2c ERB4 TaxID=2759911 RepID=A0A7G9YM78_9EURY|nr:hypothetical protein CPECMPGB_00032 [Methanosarcinales archaeon ANME-2c ERB4]QNO49149.1 hypothetical protein DBBAIPCH_00032 [Methanosarcinales archaeon ANME-2c ERB4]
MEEPKSLDRLFDKKIFRIPDYQRGYAWQKEQLKDFWEDLINLPDTRSHYTGVLTLKEMAQKEIKKSDKEYWLVEDHSYRMYHIVDGQQRLATFIIFMQAFIEFVMSLPENSGKASADTYITENLSIHEVTGKYLFKVKPIGDHFRTYKFGYTEDNPSHEYLRYRIFMEGGAGSIDETFYTLNLKNAKLYFSKQLKTLYKQAKLTGLQEVYKKLTKRFLFNEYVIRDEFDVFMAFETMNNRGKKLSDLELLKNRMIYLTTLYSDADLDLAGHQSMREDINNAWKEVYYQLGRNATRPLNDDEFLKAHWIMYFKYSKKTGRDYIRFLLDEQFSPQHVHKKVEHEAILEQPEEQKLDLMLDDMEDENGKELEESTTISVAKLRPDEIKHYVDSLKESSVHWFTSYFPRKAANLSEVEIQVLEKLNRIGMGYFRPLVMAILKNESDHEQRLFIFQRIERFIFLAFRIGNARSNYGSSVFYNAARQLGNKQFTLSDIDNKLTERLSFMFSADGTLRLDYFYNVLARKFEGGSGYYGWYGLRYFLYEYELNLLDENRLKKVHWDDLLKTPHDQISIEHICPQTPTDDWRDAFSDVPEEQYCRYNGSLGNMLLLSTSLNSSLQNDSFGEKKHPKYDENGHRIRNGYSDGSHSEIEVAQNVQWGPEQVRDRGRKLLSFMEKRWDVRFQNDADKERLLFLSSEPGDDTDSGSE